MDGQTDMVKPVYPPTTTSSSPEIIIGTETHLDPTYNNAKILPYDIASSYQYKIYRKELIDKNDGGVLIMVRPDIKSDECPDLDTECEIKWVEIRPNDKEQILIGSFYLTQMKRQYKN
jgi:hypothetical protein